MSELKETMKMKVVQLHESTPPQTQTTRKNKNRAILRKQKLLVYINKAQKSFQVRPQPKDSPIGPEKDQNDFKKAKNQRARKQKILKNESYHSI